VTVGEDADTRGKVVVDVRGAVGWITLTRPSKRNALTIEMWRAIPEAVESLSSRDDVLAIAVLGAEGTFSSGADLEDVLAATASREVADVYCSEVVRALLSLATGSLPTVALVQGVATGGGAELALACDVRIAEEGAAFSFPFARLGIVPDRFTLERLAGLVGPSNARRYVFSGEPIDAARAPSLGLVDEVVSPGTAVSWVERWAEGLARGSRPARAGMKRVLADAEGAADIPGLIGPMVDSFVGGEVRSSALRFLARG
jgi:enoyl-CoA hydratase/carnithine racemase